MHATHIRVHVAVLLWAILEGKRISVLPLIRDSMWKMTQMQKYNIPFPSMISRLATLSGMERRPIDRTSVFLSNQPYLPYGEYDGPPPQKKRKTTEPPSSAESSAPPAPSEPTPLLQTPYELGREILQAIHRFERRNARRFQWIVAKFEGRDPGLPPPDTPEPEPETEPAAAKPAVEPAAEAGQAVEPTEQRAEDRAEEAIIQRVEEPIAGVEPIVEVAAEPTNHAAQELAAETTTEPTRAIIVYQRHQHLPPSAGGDSLS
ncbi:guanine nucleotide-binding protein G(s) subunit alpha isoforms XLas-like [Arachis ipaensis]|uniref:uncharacterized protein n=1 Tax=Arachis hypogaea TaxID=3818 RepID=UPI0007AF58A5|nr:guanine nucleotide-binding protein G(s) subunit alpha isoforms XLas-like [Arachis ipaensis]XP_025648872.1 guanine nucleotide-binding protein G(s) subunit alpha isoforms XLas-like [Arachis hypogaea]QHO08028.1 uncharacterized protein DS421_14g468910 [Arachis hypogaea]